MFGRASIIEGSSQVAQSLVHQDESVDKGEFVVGSHIEDNSMNEETVTYDIKFGTLNPQHFLMTINVEYQSDFYPEYPLTKRVDYYGGRLNMNLMLKKLRSILRIFFGNNDEEFVKRDLWT